MPGLLVSYLELIAKTNVMKLFTIFSSLNFTVSGLVLKSSVHFKLIFVDAVIYRSNFILLHVDIHSYIRLILKTVGKTTRPFRYDLNQIPYDYTVEVINRFNDGVNTHLEPDIWNVKSSGP